MIIDKPIDSNRSSLKIITNVELNIIFDEMSRTNALTSVFVCPVGDTNSKWSVNTITNNLTKININYFWNDSFFSGGPMAKFEIFDQNSQMRLLEELYSIIWTQFYYSSINSSCIFLYVLLRLRNFVNVQLFAPHLDNIIRELPQARDNINFMGMFLAVYPNTTKSLGNCDKNDDDDDDGDNYSLLQIVSIKNWISFFKRDWDKALRLFINKDAFNKRSNAFIQTLAVKVCCDISPDRVTSYFSMLPEEIMVRNYSLFLIFLVRYHLKVKLTVNEYLILINSDDETEFINILKHNNLLHKLDRIFLSIISKLDLRLISSILMLSNSVGISVCGFTEICSIESFVRDMTIWKNLYEFNETIRNWTYADVPLLSQLLVFGKVVFSDTIYCYLLDHVIQHYNSNSWHIVPKSGRKEYTRWTLGTESDKKEYDYDCDYSLLIDVFVDICYEYCIKTIKPKLYFDPYYKSPLKRTAISVTELLEIYGNIYWRPICDNEKGCGIYYNFMEIRRQIKNNICIDQIYKDYKHSKSFGVCCITNQTGFERLLEVYPDFGFLF